MTDLFGSEIIRTIGLYQPYASLMLNGKLESRWVAADRKPPFPKGKYLIYATKKEYSNEEFQRIAGMFWDKAMSILRTEKTKHLTGVGLAIGELYRVESIRTISQCDEAFVEPPSPLDDSEQFTYDSHCLWGLRFKDVKRIKPFPFKGKQGVGFLSEEDKKKIVFE